MTNPETDKNKAAAEWHPRVETNQSRYQSVVEVFGNLKGISHREPIKEKVLELIEHLKAIFVIGAPGSGKTTILDGIERTLLSPEFVDKFKQKTGKPLHVARISFEFFLGRFFELYKEELGELTGLKNLLPEFLQKFEMYLTQNVEQMINDVSPGTILLIELPAVGDYPRGQDVLKKKGEQMKKTKKRKREISVMGTEIVDTYVIDSLVIHTIADPKIYDRASTAREIVKTCTNDLELKIRLKNVGIYLGEPTDDDRKQRVLLDVYLHQASPQQIEQISNEFDTAAQRTYEEIMTGNDLARITQTAIIHKEFDISEQAWQLSSIRGWYAFYQLARYFPTGEAYFVAFNENSEGVDYTR
jgi:hypothetical protein